MKKLTYAQVKKQWSEVEKEKQENKSNKKYDVANMELPCRSRTDKNDNIEVWKPLSHFKTNKNLDSLQRDFLRKGQDLVCIKCRHGLRWTNYDDVIFCSMCGLLRSRIKFDAEAQQSWESLSLDPVYCTKCFGIAAKQDDAEWTYCNGVCQAKLPDWHFVDHMLQDWQTRKSQLEIQCARCIAVQEIPATMLKCIKCQRQKKMSDFSPYAAKDWLGQQLENVGTFVWIASIQSASDVKPERRSQRIM